MVRVPWSRLAGAVGLVAVSAAIYWATTDRTFAVDPAAIPITGERYTTETDVRAALGLPDDRLVNIFRIATADIEARIEALPAVRDARVSATLPDRVAVSITERVPLLVWRTPAGSWLVDGGGLLFGSAEGASPAELGSGATGTSLPAVDDRRIGSEMGLRSMVPPLDLEVLGLLLTVSPALVRTDAPELFVSLEDDAGFVLTAPGRWRAVFGPYTPVLRPPSLIPAQVQCLDALLADREATLGTVTLALSDELCGTFTERARSRQTPRSGKGDDAPGDRPADRDGGRRGGGAATPRP